MGKKARLDVQEIPAPLDLTDQEDLAAQQERTVIKEARDLMVPQVLVETVEDRASREGLEKQDL